jgi:DNA-binding transcriptional LysR family regulator
MLTFRQIEAFRCLFLTGKTTKAAELMNISQPAVSRLLADLERELDLPLFLRNGKRLEKTAEAEALYEEVQRAYAGLARIKEAAQNIRQFPYGEICIVVIPSIEPTIGIDLIERFKSKYPRASISLEIQPTNQAFEWIHSRQASFAIAHPHLKRPGLSHAVVNRSSAIAIVPKDHPLALHSVIRPENFEGESYISFRPDSLFRIQLDTLFREREVRRDMKLECRTTEAVCRMVARGMGVSVIGPHLPKIDESDIVIRPFEPELSVELAIILPTGSKLTTLEHHMLEIIEEYFCVKTGFIGSGLIAKT